MKKQKINTDGCCKLCGEEIDFVTIFNSHPELLATPFLVEDIIDKLWGDKSEDIRMDADFEIDCFIEESPDFIAIYNETEDCRFYYHLPAVFERNEFCVKPTEDEIKEGILYPGHRFLPFISREVHASEAELFDGEQQISTCKVAKPLDELAIYHSILGFDRMIESFIMDDPDNMPDFTKPLEGTSEFNVTVMAMSDFYKKHNFKYGDTILMRVDSFVNGELSLSYCSSKEASADKGKVLKWCALFSEGIEKAIDDNDTQMTIEEEISTALIFNADYLLEHPVIHIGGFLAFSKKYSLKPLGHEAIIWHKDEDPEFFEDDDEDIDFDEMMDMMEDEMSNPPDLDSMDSILKFMGYDFSEAEVEAYMRDELFHGGNASENVWERCFDERIGKFPEYKVYEDALDKLFGELWEDVSSSYNLFADNKNGQIREKALLIKDKQTRWMRDLSNCITDLSELPKEFTELAQVSGFLSEMLAFLNDTEETIPKKESKQMLSALNAFSTMVDTMQGVIDADLRE
jgi:hypothetical protein